MYTNLNYALFLTGNGQAPRSLYLDFDDGRGYQLVTWGQPLGTTYATAGIKRVKVKATFGTKFLVRTFISHFNFEVQSVVAAFLYAKDYGFSVPLKPTGARYGANVSVRYGRNHGQHVVKPFIVVEQYNIAKAAPNLVKCNNANNTVDLFLPKIITSGNFNFNEALEAAGYDLIYIDFDNNTDDITLNAKVFERVVQEVNAWKETSRVTYGLTVEQNVVMGMSMGGLIARYGLAEMTKNNTLFGPPDTRLLVLHDSPQRGAYNPVGLQSFTRSTNVPMNLAISLNPFSSSFGQELRLRDFDDRLDDAVKVLDEPATQQLAILNAFDGRGDIKANTFIDGIYKDMVDFTLPANTSGPQPAYPIIATSDGSQCGRGSGAPLGVQLSSADTYTSDSGNLLSLILYLGRFSLGVRGAAYGLPAYGQRATISRMRVYIEYRLTIGRCPFCLSIPIRFNLLNESALSPPNTLPYETLPGGTTNLSRESGDCGNTSGIAGAVLRTSLYNGDICFVPSYSALDVSAVTPTTAFAKYVNNTTDNPSLPRVVRYVAQENPNNSSALFNLNHLTFTARNSEWIFREMQGLSPASNYCSTECLPLTIASSIAPGRLCRGSSATFSIPGLPAGTAVSWTATPADNFTVATGSGPTFTTTASSIAVGNSTITASTGGCQIASLTVGTGPGEPSGYYTGGYGSGTLTTYQTLAYPGPDGVDIGMFITEPYNFTFTADLPGLYLTETQGTSTHFILKRGQGVTITATATNAPCGLVGRFAFICPGSPYGYRFAPNPADTNLTVTAVEEGAPADAPAAADAPPFDADLYDSHGKKVKSKKSDKGKAVLDVRDLPAGLYNLRAGKGKEAISEHIQITH